MEPLRRKPSTDATPEDIEPQQRGQRVGQDLGRQRAETFAAAADAIMYRWASERDTWVSAAEVEQARHYLSLRGISTRALADGQFAVAGEVAGVVIDPAHVVLLGLRHLVHTRVSERAP